MAKFKDLTEQRFGELVVISRAPNKNKRTYWHCKCSCGNELDVRSDSLLSGNTTSCGCRKLKLVQELGQNNFKDLTNQKFNKLTALYPIKKENSSKYYWICQCECGNLVTVIGTSLTSGNTSSCGCVKSMGESKIQTLLDNNNINYKKQYAVKISNNIYFYDFAIFDSKQNIQLLIEFDGIQHFGKISGWFTEERRLALQNSDNIKNNYAIQNNIPLKRIPYQERDNLTLNMLLNEQYIINPKGEKYYEL